MSVFNFIHRFKNWVGKRDEKTLDPDRVPGDPWLDQTLHVTHNCRREPLTQKVRRTSSTIRRLSTVGIRGDKGPNKEDCKCLATEMCPNGDTDPVPCFIHAVSKS